MSAPFFVGDGKGETNAPETIEVLAALLSDLSAFESSKPRGRYDRDKHMVSYFSEFGQEPTLAKALADFSNIETRVDHLKKFLGPDGVREVMNVEMDY